ncbi:RluA family pseudouridine synthase [Cellulophaga baltica]|uniref:RluA family pseudouridine synthase n=1 Tax=Cellulophaga baltica TaxID=76594 RepID=UPI0024958C67|nr:RluA family pseudouridine synthase [Cellulophaga baltica]
MGIFSAAMTKSALKKAIKKKHLTINGTLATTATFVHGGEHIALYIPEETSASKTLIFPLKVLFEDDYLAIIHKPAGILVSGNSFKTIANALGQNLSPSKLPDATKPQPVHRLDYATTGILLAGKTSSSIRALNKMFEDKKVAKTYYAVTIGTMNAEGEISTTIDEKPSCSTYSVIASAPSERFGTLNFVQLDPKTGRRHQLRKHLASIGNPILGDKDYGTASLILKGKGMYLHAYSLQFLHPFTKKEIILTAAFPERFRKLFPIDTLIK